MFQDPSLSTHLANNQHLPHSALVHISIRQYLCTPYPAHVPSYANVTGQIAPKLRRSPCFTHAPRAICHLRHILPSLLGNKPNSHGGASGTQLKVEKTNERSDHPKSHHHHNQIKIVHQYSDCGTRGIAWFQLARFAPWGLWEAPADQLSPRKVF